MANINEIIRVAVDAYRGTNTANFSVDQTMDSLHQALVEANNGSTKLDFKAIRDGKCNGLFTIVEEILSRTIVQGFQEDDYFMALVDFRNVAAGDQKEFEVEDDDLFVVSTAADGTQGIRRQRLGGKSSVAVPTEFKVVKIYEELNRVLARQVDFNKFIQKVSESFRKQLLADVYALWNGVTAEQLGGTTYYPAAGVYDEDVLLDLIAHVEAASGGKSATIVGTKKAVRNLRASIESDESKSDLYNLGYYGKFYGTPVVATPQRHKLGTSEFLFEDDVLTIIAGDQKPIKCVYEGDSLILLGNPSDKADLTQEFTYGEKYGLGLILAGGNSGVGRYEFTTV